MPKYLERLYLEPGLSKWLIILLSASHLGAIVICLLCPIAWTLKILLSLASLGSILYLVQKNVLYNTPRSIVRLWENQEDMWSLETAQGDTLQGHLCSDSLRTTFLVILIFRIPGRWRIVSVSIFADAINKDLFRKLRVRLFMK